MFWADTQLFSKIWILIPNWFDKVPNYYQIQGWKLKFQGQKSTWLQLYIMITANDRCFYSSYEKYYITKLKGYKEIPCFKYLNQVFCALSFCFIILTQLIFILGVSLLKLKINNVVLPKWLNFDGIKYPNAPKTICCSVNWPQPF